MLVCSLQVTRPPETLQTNQATEGVPMSQL